MTNKLLTPASLSMECRTSMPSNRLRHAMPCLPASSISRCARALALKRADLAENRACEPPGEAGNECGARYGQDPRPDNGARDAPSHGRDVVRRAHSDDRAGDGVGGRDRDAER